MAKGDSRVEKAQGSGDLLCRVLTPTKTVFNRRVDSVELDTAAGRLEVFANFEPTIAPLTVGIMTANDADGNESRLAIHGGYMDMNGGVLVVLADSAEIGDEVDVVRARTALARARELLAQVTNDNAADVKVDADRAKLAIMRALARLKVAGQPVPPGEE